MKLAWSLPALDTLDESQLDQVWRLAGGHPRSLEYLDALLSGGTARYPDVTTRLNKAITKRLTEGDRQQWLSAHTDLNAALAESIALAADDILLDDLLAQMSQTRGALELLLGISVYREPVDHNAILFQGGQHAPDSEHIPDRNAISQRISEVLDAAGITPDDSLDPASIPNDVRVQLAPHLARLNQLPTPPYLPSPQLPEQIATCQASSLLNISGDSQDALFFVHRWTATELANRQSDSQLAETHHRAAAYWLWRVRVWPQDKAAGVHDQLEARYHLLRAGNIDGANQITEGICRQLETWGAWDQEATLIHDTLTWLPLDSPRQAAHIHHLGILAQRRGDYDEARRLYQRCLDIGERVGDQAGMADSYHQLGMLAQARADYDEAERQYQRSLDIDEQLGDQAGMADSYHQLGIVAYLRGDYDEARRLCQRSLGIKERFGDQAGMAASYSQLGLLAQGRGDYDEAQRQYRRSLDIDERVGNQAGMAIGYHQLGNVAYLRGDYDEAQHLYQRALGINERLGDQAGMAYTYGQLGNLARLRGDFDEGQRQYLRSLQISERLGGQAGMAISYSNLGTLEAERGGRTNSVVSWDLKALAIRLRLGVPEAIINLRRLAACRRELGLEPFTTLLAQAVDNSKLVETITSLLDELDMREERIA
jgi:tetratricopeptide (TPR) repeat protein